MKKNKVNFSKIIVVFCGLFPLLPNNLKPVLIFAITFYALINYTKVKKHIFLKTLPITIVFFVYSTFFLFSTNKENGVSLLIRMLPLLLVPSTFFLFLEYNVDKLKLLKNTFIFSSCIYSILILFYLNYLGCFNHETSFEIGYSHIINDFFIFNDHPIYISTYLSITIIILIIYPYKNSLINLVLLIILFLGLISLSRKGSIIALIFCFIYLFMLKKKIIAILSIILISTFVIFLFPTTKRLIEDFKVENMDKNPETTTGIRIIVWENVSNLAMSPNNYFGYGLGNVQNVINRSIRDNGYPNIANQNYNSHNQYLQFMMSVGYIGTLIILSFFIFIAIKIYVENKQNVVFFGFFLLLFLTESYLERQNGIIFFSFISVFFYWLSFIKTRNQENN